jgi:hypothetical protein
MVCDFSSVYVLMFKPILIFNKLHNFENHDYLSCFKNIFENGQEIVETLQISYENLHGP